MKPSGPQEIEELLESLMFEWEKSDLGRITRLETGMQAFSDALRPLPRMPTVREMWLHGGSIDRDTFALLAERTPNLRVLRIYGRHSATAEDLAQLTRLLELRALDIGGCDGLRGRLRVVEAFSRLRQLGVAAAGLEDRDVDDISRASKLEELDVSQQPLTDACCPALASMPALRELLMEDTLVTDDGVASLPPLEKLTLPPRATDRSLAVVAKWQNLKALNGAGAFVDEEGGVFDIGDEGVQHLRCCQCLSSLSLQDSNVSDESLKALGELRTLRYLDISGTQVTKRGSRNLAAKLPKCNLIDNWTDD